MSQQFSVFAYAVPLRCNALVVGITAAIGIIGGIFIITQSAKNVYGKIVDKRSLKDSDAEDVCNVCCGALEPKDVKSFVTCFVCKKSVCRGATCADWQPKTASWVCQLCGSSKQSMANTSSWVAEQMSFNQQKLVYPLRARSEIYIPITDCNEGSMHFESVSQVGVNAETVTAAQKLKIREYVEEVVANMLGGSLDKVAVEQLSKSETYLPAIANGHSNHHVSASNTNLAQSSASGNNNSTMDFANFSEARLRQLIESIIAETLRLPNALATATGCGAVSEIALDTRSKDADIMTNGAAGGRRHRTEHYFEPQIYQDLLATAVLNKIVDKQSNGRLLAESTPDLSGQNVDSNFNVENQSTTSDSSLEPRSDCSYSTDTELNVEKADDNSAALLSAGRESVISDYIASHMVPLPDLSTPATESEEDDYASVNSSAVGEGTWEDNWLFKKKRTSASSTCGVGMLVPAPKEDVRAQIGDKTADEVSDLSEMGSDTDDSSLDLLRANINPLNDRLLSKQLIGGQNTKIVLDELIETTSLISNTALAENEPVFIETKNVHVIDPATKTKAINADIDQSQNQAKREGAAPEVESNEANDSADLSTSHPLSDQLSSNHTDDSPPSYIETYSMQTDCDETVGITATVLCNGITTILTTSTTTTTNNTNHTLTNVSPRSAVNGDDPEHLSNGLNNGVVYHDDDDDDDDSALFRRFVPGSIAEREYMKWNNAVEMPNNPYAPEALKRRISGSQERFIDLPKISPSTEQNPLALLQNEKDETDTVERTREDYKRYSRDYYINESKANASGPKRHTTSEFNISDDPSTDHITINEVIANGTNCSRPSSRTHSDCHWTLSTPVRRSSSLKFINNSPHDFTKSSYRPLKSHHQSTPPPLRSSTSASHYNDDYDVNDDDEDDIRSQRSWKSCSAKLTGIPIPPSSKRRPHSSLSLHSSGSGVSHHSSVSKKRSTPSSSLLSQFEKQLLHKDLKRNSFRAISATTKDFVMNPLFDRDQFFGADGRPKLSVRPDNEEQVDSGVDSCLNGFCETDAKQSNNSLLF